MPERIRKTKTEDTALPVLTHVLGLLTSFLGPLIVFLASEDGNSREHSKMALNWQFSYILYTTLFLTFGFVPLLFAPEEILGGLSFFFFMGIIFVFSILNLIFSIIAAVKSSKPELWKYPLAIPFFKPS